MTDGVSLREFASHELTKAWVEGESGKEQCHDGWKDEDTAGEREREREREREIKHVWIKHSQYYLLILQNFEAFDSSDFSDSNDIVPVVPDQQSSPKSTGNPATFGTFIIITIYLRL